jgi:hypothetical protein
MKTNTFWQILGVLLLALGLGTLASADSIGSSLVPRPSTDGSAGQVYIYAGGFFASGVTVTQDFSWVNSQGYGTGYLTPILFNENSTGVFTVLGVGQGVTVPAASTSPQSIPFVLQYGSDVTGSDTTFGFIEGLVNGSGDITAVSSGDVDLDYNAASDPGDGAGGAGTTNDWVFTPSDFPAGSLPAGLTFSLPGYSGNVALECNCGTYNVERTYSAQMDVPEAGPTSTPEPGTMLLLGSGLMGVARLVRRKRSA